jgi:hypothetical protein
LALNFCAHLLEEPNVTGDYEPFSRNCVKLTEKPDVHEQIYDAAIVGRLFALSDWRKWCCGKAAVLANLRADQTF